MEEKWANRTLSELTKALTSGEITTVDLVDNYLTRIDELDRNGPALHAILALNPDVRKEAAASDEARKAGAVLGPLHGVPLLVKDNIEVAGPLPTTAGSLALKENVTNRDAPVVAQLKKAGALILGKTNLSEWANFRSHNSISGWSALGGQTKNPHRLTHSPCGSSSGSAVAIAAGMAPGAVGTETSGSIICPAALCGIVGFKPTVGMIASDHIIPISATTDTAGPMTRTVADAVIMFKAMVKDDWRTEASPVLDAATLEGARIGVLKFGVGNNPDVAARFELALKRLKEAGADLVEIETLPDKAQINWQDFETLLKTEFKDGLNAYLATTPDSVTARTLADVITFNQDHAAEEMPLFDQSLFHASQEMGTIDETAFLELRTTLLEAARDHGLDEMLTSNEVDVLVSPSEVPAGPIDPKDRPAKSGRAGVGWLPALAGYPHLTVPMGLIDGLPVGLSFMSGKHADARVLELGYAFESAWNAKR